MSKIHVWFMISHISRVVFGCLLLFFVGWNFFSGARHAHLPVLWKVEWERRTSCSYNRTGSRCPVDPHSSFRIVSACHISFGRFRPKNNQFMPSIVQSSPNKQDSGNKQLYLPSYPTGGHRQSPKGRRSPGKARKGVGSTFFIDNKRSFPSSLNLNQDVVPTTFNLKL